MQSTETYSIRQATDDDAWALRWLAELDNQRLLHGPALIGEIDGIPAAAISLTDGRVAVDPFQATAVLRQLLCSTWVTTDFAAKEDTGSPTPGGDPASFA